MIKSLKLAELNAAELVSTLQTAISPRPICFASTQDGEGRVNLAPFSFFNLFSFNPPVCVFSPSRRMRDGSTKHTLENLQAVPECVINTVSHAMVQQVSLASCDFPEGVNEFEKSGFSPIPSILVAPPRVAESPVQMECKVLQIIPLSDSPGAGNLVLAEVLYIHVRTEFLDEGGRLDQTKLDLVGRLGGDWYTRVNSESMFKVPKPNANVGIGIDALPEYIRHSSILTGNHLGILGNSSHLPAPAGALPEELRPELSSLSKELKKQFLHRKAGVLIDSGQLEKAWQVLYFAESFA